MQKPLSIHLKVEEVLQELCNFIHAQGLEKKNKKTKNRWKTAGHNSGVSSITNFEMKLNRTYSFNK